MLSWKHLSLLPTILRDFLEGLSSNRKPVLVIIVYWDCCQIFLHWRLKFLIKLSYQIFLSSVHSIFKFKASITKNHKAIRCSKWVHQVFPITGIMLSMLSRRFILKSIIKSTSVIYTNELHFTITHSFFKRQSQMCSRLHQLSWGKGNGYMSKTELVLVLTNERGRKIHIPNFWLKQIEWIKYWPTRHLRPETGESLERV